jgi:hypothetical protein
MEIYILRNAAERKVTVPWAKVNLTDYWSALVLAFCSLF